MERRASSPGISLFRRFFFCCTPPLAYPLSVKLSIIRKVSVEKVRVGTAAPAHPSRAPRARSLSSCGDGRPRPSKPSKARQALADSNRSPA